MYQKCNNLFIILVCFKTDRAATVISNSEQIHVGLRDEYPYLLISP